MNNFKVGFPRSEQRCHVHVIPRIILSLGIREKTTPEVRQAALEYLVKSGADLVYGDLVIFPGMNNYFEGEICICAEREIVRLEEHFGESDVLPRKFQCLNGVSLCYWEVEHDQLPSNKFKLNIWVNLESVRDEALSNIKVHTEEHNDYGQVTSVVTSFVNEGETYYLVYLTHTESEDTIKDFREHLSFPGVLSLSVRHYRLPSNKKYFHLRSDRMYMDQEITEKRTETVKSARKL